MGDVTVVAIRVERLAPLPRTATAQVAFHPGLGVRAAERLQPEQSSSTTFPHSSADCVLPVLDWS